MGKITLAPFLALAGSLIEKVAGGGLNEPFRVYLATNLHVAAVLKNQQDYDPYKNSDTSADWTTAFRIGKYTHVRDFVEPSQVKLPNNAQAFVNVQTTVIPKTAFTAHDFVNYTLPKDKKKQNDTENKKKQPKDGENDKQKEQAETQPFEWIQQKDADDKKESNTANTSDSLAYADFAVLELTLFLDNPVDKKVFDHFIQPAIKTYEQLGNSLKLFAKPTLTELKNHRYYLSGYPFLENKVNVLSINQIKKDTSTETTINGQTVQQSNHEQPLIVRSTIAKPTLIRNQGDDFNGSNWVWNYDNSRVFRFEQTFQSRNYQQYGKGFVLDNAGFTSGASGALVLNDKHQITGIYFASTSNTTTAWGVAQLLRWKANGHNNDGTNTVAYDLIFGNKDTKKYYAQFAKQHKTHLFEQIKQSNDQQFTFVKNQKS